MSEVTHFARHLVRNHKEEGAIQELTALPQNNPRRKILLDTIRRQGNYVLNQNVAILRPIRRPRFNVTTTETSEYLACNYCLGYFKRRYLRRHRRTCKLRTNEPSGRENHLSEAQMFSVCTGEYKDFYSTLRVTKEVFPIMKNDDVSKAAMGDVLICSFGESQIQKHKRTQIKNVISNKMREMGRLFIALKQSCGAEKLFDILKPEYFDNFVGATKVISGYNEDERTFRASSLALHMGTNLKNVCNIATKLIIKKSRYLKCENVEQCLKDIKRLKNLIEQHWNSELSSLALKNLQEQQWQKPKLLPLTNDVMQFQQYVISEANIASDNLKNTTEIKKNFRKLTECVLALTLLLNRKRIGEIQYLKLKTYCAKQTVSHQSEFLESLTESEKLLSKQFMRVVTGGKGSKPVPILFPTNLQKYIDILLNARTQCVSDKNEYLFANPNTEDRWISGYHTLKKLANESKVNNKDLFTSTRLRKHIATVIQVLNLTSSEMEQFASFMGHTKKTHEEYYRYNANFI